MNGYIKIHRKLEEWEWYKKSEAVHLFLHFIFKANFKDSRFEGYDIPRGSFVAGRKQISEDTGISERTVRTFIKKLIDTHEITVKTTNRFSIITVCNYCNYQDKEIESDQQVTNNRPTSDQQVTTSEEVKKERREEETLKSIAIPDHLKAIWPFYLEMRKLIKKPATDNAQESTIKKLEKLAPGNNQLQIEIIQQSIDNSWQGVFELKANNQNQRKKYEYERGTESKYDNLQTASNSDD